MRIEQVISHGHASPEVFWYDQSQHEWVRQERLLLIARALESEPSMLRISAHLLAVARKESKGVGILALTRIPEKE